MEFIISNTSMCIYLGIYTLFSYVQIIMSSLKLSCVFLFNFYSLNKNVHLILKLPKLRINNIIIFCFLFPIYLSACVQGKVELSFTVISFELLQLSFLGLILHSFWDSVSPSMLAFLFTSFIFSFPSTWQSSSCYSLLCNFR